MMIKKDKYILFITLATSANFTTGLNFDLSSILDYFIGQEDSYQRPEFPRRDLVQEYGLEAYKCLVSEALDTTGERDVCVTPENPISDRYGVDVSFPTHYFPPEEEREHDYKIFLGGCKKYYNHRAIPRKKGSHSNQCQESEIDRVDMNMNQPRVMQNYTALGFRKMRAPKDLQEVLTTFWTTNKNYQQKERWSPGDTHINHWEAPTYMVSVDNPHLEGGGMNLKNQIWEAGRSILQDWIGKDRYPLSPSSLYGVRVYREGAILAPHVDRLPLVTSAIINVAQDVLEPWPLEVIAHDGKAYNVTLDVGDMLLYESHSVIHGRPYPLKGEMYANIFIHFEPEGHCNRHADRMNGKTLTSDAEELYKRAQQKAKNRKLASEPIKGPRLPDYIEEGGLEEKRWLQQITELPDIEGFSTDMHSAARGNISWLKKLITNHPEMINARDKNGWQPIHEAARSDSEDCLKLLLEHGADMNSRTNGGRGGSPLFWAESKNPNTKTAKLLREMGAEKIRPQFEKKR